MPGRVLLDSSILVDHLRGDAKLESRLAESDEVFVSVVALGELLYGVRRSAHTGRGRALLDDFIQGVSVLPCDRLTAEAYGRLKDSLRRKGRPIPDNDLWIAATALQHGLTLAERDEYFSEIEGLDHERW